MIPSQYCVLSCVPHAYAPLLINMHYMAHMGGACMINMLIISLGTSICTFACRDRLREMENKQKKQKRVTAKDKSQSYKSNTAKEEGVLISCFNKRGQGKLIPLAQSSW